MVGRSSVGLNRLQSIVPLLDAVQLSFLTTPLITPATVLTLPQRRGKGAVSDPGNSFCGDAPVSVEPTLLNRPVTGADRMGSEQVS